jgi:predicted alpha/beta hydrolase family esterase
MILNIPGFRNSGPDHWQSCWELQYPQQFVRVEQESWHEPEKEAWVARLGEVVGRYRPEELVLVGHSVGCATILHAVKQWGWQLKAAVFVGPSDVDHPNYPHYIKNFGPMPLDKLSFPSVVVASDNDHVVSLQRATYFAACLGSRLEVVREAGHFLPKDGYGPWPEGLKLLLELNNID